MTAPAPSLTVWAGAGGEYYERAAVDAALRARDQTIAHLRDALIALAPAEWSLRYQAMRSEQAPPPEVARWMSDDAFRAYVQACDATRPSGMAPRA